MKKSQTIFLWILLGFSLIFLIIYKLLGTVDDGRTKPIEYPVSNLSQDLFVSQNTEYVENEVLNDTYSFKTVPYMVDLAAGSTADVETGHLVEITDDVIIFASENPKDADTNEVILNQYPPAIYMNYSQQASYAQTVVQDMGYINGYHAKYFIDHLLISVGPSVTAKSIYMIGYTIDLGSEYENNIILAMATTIDSTENLALCKQYLDGFVYTLRYDEKLAQTLAYEKAEEERKAELEARNAEKVESSSADSGAASVSGTRYPIVANRDFKNMSVLVSWDNSEPNLSMDIVNEAGVSIANNSTVTSKMATFDCGARAEGTYYIQCDQLSRLGKVKVKLIESGGN